MLFSTGSVNATYSLDIQDDDVALEDREVFTLSLSGPSDNNTQIGGTVGGVVYYDTTTVTILDDDCEGIICVFYIHVQIFSFLKFTLSSYTYYHPKAFY